MTVNKVDRRLVVSNANPSTIESKNAGVRASPPAYLGILAENLLKGFNAYS